MKDINHEITDTLIAISKNKRIKLYYGYIVARYQKHKDNPEHKVNLFKFLIDDNKEMQTALTELFNKYDIICKISRGTNIPKIIIKDPVFKQGYNLRTWIYAYSHGLNISDLDEKRIHSIEIYQDGCINLYSNNIYAYGAETLSPETKSYTIETFTSEHSVR